MLIEKYALYLVRLCKCAIEDTQAVPPDDNFDFNLFCKFCQDHRLANIAYIALKNSNIEFKTDSGINIFKERYEQALLNDAAQQYHLERITESFSENNIDYVLLKGMVMKKLYPSSDLRQSSDIDIYIKPDDRLKARIIMEDLGFINTNFSGIDSTDNYNADKFSYVELHKKLVASSCQWEAECNKITDRLIRKDNHELTMTDEDFYIFMICHIAKHMKHSGIGIRSILDIWVYRKAHKELDDSYINAILDKCKLTPLHEKLLNLVGYWFENALYKEDTHLFGLHIASSGWDGSVIQAQSFGIRKLGGFKKSVMYIKLKSFLTTVFVNCHTLKEKYKILKKHPTLLPFCWIYRCFDVLLHRPENINAVLHKYDNLDMEEAVKINELRIELGL